MRKGVIIVFLFLILGLSLYTPTNLGPSSSDPSRGIESSFPIENVWRSADSPEGPVIYNNLEDFVDVLSDLHPESDIGSHSSPLSLKSFDGFFDTLTSDNITIPERLIVDPLNETPSYNQSAYESWQLDLEGGWTNVDHDEVSAELCVYGGLQANESLQVDVWSDNNWVNVIPDVQSGWNNVSVSSSLIDETLEMRFKNSVRGNTSIQNSWDIDCVLLHTWTTIYSEEYTSNGFVQEIGDNLYRYTVSAGEANTYNEQTDTWHRYLYDPDTKSVKIGTLTITHLAGGALSIDGEEGSHIGKLSWYIQTYYGGDWQNITLPNYSFEGFTKTDIDVTMHQRFWGPQGEMNVYLTYSYFGGFKTRVDITNNAATGLPVRAIWAAQDVRGIQDNYNLVYTDDVLSGIQIEDAYFNWNDVLVSDNPLPTKTVVDKPNRRAAVIFGNMSTVIPSGYTATIDPTYTLTSDAYDNYWDFTGDPDGTDVDDAVHNLLDTVDDYGVIVGFPVTIPEYAIVTSAILDVFVQATSGEKTVTVYRINSGNMPMVDNNINGDGTVPTVDGADPTSTVEMASAGFFCTGGEVSALAQLTLNEATWASGNIMGFRLFATGDGDHEVEDVSDGNPTHRPYITIIYEAAATNWLTGWGYRQGHSIDGSTGAGPNYQIRLNVEYGFGTSVDGTIYCNEKSQPDFDDIYFTEVDGETPLDYWREEKTDSDDATFWVEVSADLGTDKVIYCYYGNATVSTTSNGRNSFIFFDDFELGAFNWSGDWELEGASWSRQNSIASRGSWAMYCDDPSGVDSYIRTIAIDYASDHVIHFSARADVTTKAAYGRWTTDGGTGYDFVSQGADWQYYDGSYKDWPAGGTAVDFAVNTWYDMEARVDVDASVQTGYKNGASMGTIDYPSTTGTGTTISKLYMGAETGTDVWFDAFFIRKWNSAGEPASLAWGAEETLPPVIDQAPTLDNPSDTDNMYAHYVKYQITVYVSDGNGYASIDYLEIGLWDNARSTEYWRGRYDEDTDVFSEQYDGGTYVELDVGSSTATESGDDIDATFYITVDWDFPDGSDLDTYCYVIDGDLEEADEWYEVVWDVETRLDMTGMSTTDGSGTAGRGDYDSIGTVQRRGYLLYYLSDDVRPPSGEVDIHATCADIAGSPWESSAYSDETGYFTIDVDSDDVVGQDTYYVFIVPEGEGAGGTQLLHGSHPFNYVADYMTFISTVSKTWTVIGETVTVTLSGKYAYPDGNSDVPSVVWSNMDSGDVSYETMGLREWNYTSSGDTHGITKYFTTNASCVWDDVVFTSGPSHYWSQESEERVWFIWGVASAYEWDYNNSALHSGFLIQSIVNDTNNAYATTYGGSIGGLAIGVFGPEYYAANITITITIDTYVITLWSQTVIVDILHSLQFVSWSLVPTDYYFWIQYQTNLMNASITIWDDVVDAGTLFADNIYHSDDEGMHQIPVDDTVGNHHYTICITSTGTDYDRDYTVDDYTWWYNFTNVVPVDVSIYETNIVIIDNLGRVIEFDTFEVFKNGSRLYASTTVTYSNIAYNITVMDRWGETLNSTVFDTGDHEFVLIVNTYSLKVMSWFEDFVFFNITHGELTYYEVVTPIEPIEFVLFAGTYDWVVDYRNGSTVEGDITLTGSTAIIITGSTIADVAGYSAALLAMTTEINVTVVATNNYVLTISIDLDNINTTINEQLIQVLLNITNTNSTIYDQTIDLLAYLQNVNSTLFNQTVDIIVELNYISSNVTAGFISVAADLFAIDSNLYSNFTSVTATLSLIDSSLLSNFTEIVSTLSAIGSNVTSNFITLTATLAAMDSSLLSNFTSVAATLSLIDSNLLSNFTSVTSTLSAIGSNVTSNYIAVIATLAALDSSLLSNFTSVSATLSLIDSNLLSNFTSVTSTLSAIGSNVTANYLSVSALLSAIDTNLLANFTSVSATLSLIDSNLLSNFTSVTSTLSAIGSNVTSNYISLAATLALLDSSLLSNFTSVSATLSLIDSNMLSNFTSVTSTLSAIGSNVTANYLSVIAELALLDSSLLSNFTSVSATLSLIDSNMLSNFTEVTSTLSAIGSNVTSNYLAVAATLLAIDSNLYSNFTSVTSTLSAIGSNITTNYLDVVATLTLIDSQLSSNFTNIVAQLLSVNSSITSQFITVIAYAAEMNATMYLIDDPTHLNPLVLGSKLSDDYCDFTVVTTWHNSTLEIYDNNVLRTGPTSELLSPIRYPLMSTSGTHNLSVFVDGGSDSFWYNISYTVAEVIAFEIEDYDFDLTDDWIYITIQTNYDNGTFYIWDNTTYVGASYEGSYPFAINNTIGLHVLTVLMNCSQGSLDATSQNRTGTDSDLWEFLEFRYTINPVTFSITSLTMMQNNESIIVAGFWHTPNTTLTWIAYEAGVLIDSGVLTLTASGEYNAIYWMKNEPTSFNNLTLSITADGSTINLHSYSLVLDTATYLTMINAPTIVHEGDTFIDESTTQEGIPVEDMVTVVMELAVLVFLAVILSAIITWRDGRKERREDYLARVASGGYQ